MSNPKAQHDFKSRSVFEAYLIPREAVLCSFFRNTCTDTFAFTLEWYLAVKVC